MRGIRESDWKTLISWLEDLHGRYLNINEDLSPCTCHEEGGCRPCSKWMLIESEIRNKVIFLKGLKRTDAQLQNPVDP